MTSAISTLASHTPVLNVDDVEMIFLDVGQGDATLVVDRSSQLAMLIDCPAGREAVVESVLRDRSAQLHTAVITHWDFDHYGGILAILDSCGGQELLFNFDTLIASNDRTQVKATLRRLRAARFGAVRLSPALRGSTGTIGNFRFELLSPTQRQLLDALTTGERNRGSAVVSVEANGQRVIVGGDADGRVWKQILDDGLDVRASALRWPHHGALRGNPEGITEDDLARAVDAELVVFSVGSNNRHGHPLPGAVDAAAGSGATVMCTQVTSRCHAAATREESCAGSIGVTLTASGLVVGNPTRDAHRQTVAAWSTPLCLAQHY